MDYYNNKEGVGAGFTNQTTGFKMGPSAFKGIRKARVVQVRLQVQCEKHTILRLRKN